MFSYNCTDKIYELLARMKLRVNKIVRKKNQCIHLVVGEIKFFFQRSVWSTFLYGLKFIILNVLFFQAQAKIGQIVQHS